MKQAALILSLAMIVVFKPWDAFALYVAGAQRPVVQSELQIAQSEGIYFGSENVNVVVFQKDGEGRPSFLNLSVDGETLELPVVSHQEDGCQIGHLVATEDFIHIMIPDGQFISRVTAEIMDQSANQCASHILETSWQVAITAYDQNGEIMGVIHANGDPVPTYTIQKTVYK